jgi:copper chaperone CopZ
MSHYMHHVPGRLRVRSPEIKRNDARAVVLQACLEQIEGVECVMVNTVTGSVTVNYDKSATDSQALIAKIESHGCFDRSRALNAETHLQRSASKVGDTLGKFVLGMVVEKAVERGAVALIGALL